MGRLAKLALAALAALVAAWLPASAQAHPLDTWGFTSRAIAMGGAGTAAATDVDAAYYNPAAATRTRAFAASVGVLVADDALEIDGADAGLATHALIQAGLSTPIPLGRLLRDRLFLTVAITLPSDGLFDVQLPDDEAVALPFWEGRNRRLVLTGALAGRLTDWLSVGIGASLMATVDASVRVELTGGQGDNALGVGIGYDFAPIAGLLVEPLEWLAFGVTYRGAQRMTLDLPVDVQVLDGAAPVLTAITARAFDVPHQVALGVQVRPIPCHPERLVLAADVTWYGYSATVYPSPDVVVRDDAGEILRESRATPLDYRDVWAVRLGAEGQALPWLQVRGGWAYVPSPVPAQTGATNIMDADRQVLSLGLGFDLPAEILWEGSRGVRFDVHGQVHLLQSRAFDKAEFLPDNPGFPSVEVSGAAYSLGATARLLF